MQEETFDFHPLRIEEVPELAKLASHSFGNYDPFLVEIKVTSEDLYETILADLTNMVDDKLVVVAKSNKTNKIVGSWAGIRLKKYFQEEPKNKVVLKDLILPHNIQELPYLEKLKHLDEIDRELLLPLYLQHKERNELETAIFCDYFCIGEDYFGSNLSKHLMVAFLIQILSQGIVYAYGSFFNKKAVKLLMGFGESKINNELSLYIGDKKLNKKFEVYLIGGYLDKPKDKKLEELKTKF